MTTKQKYIQNEIKKLESRLYNSDSITEKFGIMDRIKELKSQ